MLESISIKYDAVEDRLLLRIRTRDQDAPVKEHALHLTRRVCAVWRKQLHAMVEMSAEAPQRLDKPTRQAIAASHHEAMATRANYQPAPPEQAEPPKEPPILVTKVVCGKRRTDNRWVMRFELLDRATLSLVLSSQTLHGVIDMLGRRLKGIGWGLPPLPGEATGTAEPARKAPSALH